MKSLFYTVLFTISAAVCFGQTDNVVNQTNPSGLSRASKISDTKSQHKENLSNAGSNSTLAEQEKILQKYLGVSSFDHPEIKERKQKLYNENPQAYQKMLEDFAALNQTKTMIKRAEYESFTTEKKNFIDSNSDKYQIVD